MAVIGCLTIKMLLFTAILVNMFMTALNYNACSSFTNSFVGLTDCYGQAGNNFIIKTLNNVEGVECAHECYETYQCMLVFYNSMTRSCSLHNRTLMDIEMTHDDSSSCYVDNGITASWIVEIMNFSSFFSDFDITNMTGPPDYSVWAPSDINQEDFMEVRFSTEMYIEQIHIYEVHHAGGVREISLLTPGSTWYPVWSTDQLEDVETDYMGRILSPDLEMTHFKTSTVRIDIGARSEYEVIDAVQVLGKTQRLSVRVHVP